MTTTFKTRTTRFLRTLTLGIASLGIADAAHADSRAAQKLGQMNIINQQLQSKPPRSSPGYQNAPNTNPSINSNNPATVQPGGPAAPSAPANPPAGAYPLKPNTR